MRNNRILLLVFLLGFLLRFYNLAGVPPSLSHDEVAIGYNAYSILKTGKDEYGTSWPLLFRSFDDYKLPGMIYLTVPSIAIFGLNEFGVRLPSALLAVLTILVFYFLVKEVFSTYRLSLIASLLLAISPWHINFSRQSFESNGALSFLVIGVFFLVRSLKNPKSIIVSAFFLALSAYFYYSVRLVIPFILFVFLLAQWRFVKRNFTTAITALIFGIFLISPVIPLFLSQGGLARVSMVSVANDTSYRLRKDNYNDILAKSGNSLMRFIYNPTTALIVTAGENYWKNITPQHIFESGTGSRGLIYKWEIPFFLFGIVVLLTLKNPLRWIFVAWLLTAPLTGAFSTNQPNSLRTLLNTPMFSVLTALGLTSVLNFLTSRRIKKLFFLAVFLIALFFFIDFANQYFLVSPKQNSQVFGDGYKQMVKYIKTVESNYDKIYISGHYWRPYIFVLFWSQYPPDRFHGVGSLHGFDKYSFTGASWDPADPSFLSEKLPFKLEQGSGEERSLLILVKPEFEKHRQKLEKLETIDGIFAKEVFIAATLKE